MHTFRHANIPENAGLWFPLIKDMLCFHRSKVWGKSSICVSWDKNEKAQKAFGIFESAADYFAAIAKMPSGKRCGYEIVLENKRCKLYLDVEWDSATADNEALEKICKICNLITDKIRGIPGREAEVLDFYISTCSRTKKSKKHKSVVATVLPHDQNAEAQRAQTVKSDGAATSTHGVEYKNSFHIVVDNVVFENNHDGTMKHFVSELGFVNMIDGKVYTRNRNMRTEMSCKFGDNVPFCNVNGTGAARDAAVRMRELEQSLISLVDLSLPRLGTAELKEANALKRKFELLPAHKLNVQAAKRACITGVAKGECSASEKSLCRRPSDAIAEDWEIPKYFRDMFEENGRTVFRISKVITTDEAMPVVARRLLERGCITLADMRFVYVMHAKCCVSQLMSGIHHSHSSNNGCAMAIRLEGRIDMYTRCYGCDQRMFSKINQYEKNMLPSLSKNLAFRNIVQSPYGIDGVCDSEHRIRVVAAFQKTQDDLKAVLRGSSDLQYTSSLAYIFDKIVNSAAYGWILVSEPI